MDRKELLNSPEYWISRIQIALYNCAEKFMMNNKKNRTQLAEHLGVTKGYVTQLLNGDYDHKLSKLIELSLAFGFIPKFEFIPVTEFIENEQKFSLIKGWKNRTYKASKREGKTYDIAKDGFETIKEEQEPNIAA